MSKHTDTTYCNRLSTSVGPYTIDIHTHPEDAEGRVDWVLWSYGEEPITSAVTTDIPQAKAEAWLALGLELGFVEVTVTDEIKERLEYLRGEINAERISTSELAELEGLAKYIDESDVQLREWAGIPEN